MIDTVVTEAANELAELLNSDKRDWGRLRFLQQILKAAQAVAQIEGQLLSNRHKHGELLLLKHELETLANFIRNAGGSVHRFRIRELTSRAKAQQIIRHGLETGIFRLIPAISGSNDLDIIQINHTGENQHGS